MVEEDKPVVLVTGGSGLVGRALAGALRPAYTPVGTDLSEPSSAVPYHSVHYMDVTSGPSVRYALRQISKEYGTRLAAVVHLAAPFEADAGDARLHERVSIEGTARLLRMLEPFDVGRFILSSSMLVHAPVRPGQAIREDSPLNPSRPFARFAVETEEVVRRHRPPVRHTLLRMASVYDGFGRHPMLIRWILKIRDRDFEGHIVRGDSRAGHSMVHVDDVADAIVRTVDRRSTLEDGPILIGEPDAPSHSELHHAIGRLLWGERWPTVHVPEPVARAAAWIEEKASREPPSEPYLVVTAGDHYALDVTRAREALGWEPKHRLIDELPGMIETMRRYPVAWQRANGLLDAELAEVEPIAS